jgi:hypothetical protein
MSAVGRYGMYHSKHVTTKAKQFALLGSKNNNTIVDEWSHSLTHDETAP